MEQIIIQVKDSDKVKLLLDLFKSLDFVNLVSIQRDLEEKKKDLSNEERDFFDYAGLWKNREISVDSIRQSAWPRQSV